MVGVFLGNLWTKHCCAVAGHSIFNAGIWDAIVICDYDDGRKDGGEDDDDHGAYFVCLLCVLEFYMDRDNFHNNDCLMLVNFFIMFWLRFLICVVFLVM